MKEHWLSVVIPAYNCSDTIERLLDSIVIQDTNDVEIIICDDQSTDNFMDKVNPYKNKFDIKYCKTEKREIHCPGNTRIDAMKYATGKYITFMDADDLFIEEAFSTVKELVKNYPEYKVIYTQILIYFQNENKYIKASDSDLCVYIHGKYFNRKWLLENDITFKENLYMIEDMHFNNLIIFNLIGQNDICFMLNKPTCIKIENNNPNSFTGKMINNNENIYEKYFDDYCFASLDGIFKCINKYPNSFELYKEYMCKMLIFIYLYAQSFIYKENDIKKYNENKLIIKKKYLEQILQHISMQDILNYIYNNPEEYEIAKNTIESSNKYKFIEIDSLYNYMVSLMN